MSGITGIWARLRGLFSSPNGFRNRRKTCAHSCVAVVELLETRQLMTGVGAPPISASAHSFYIDPIHGSMSGNGSQSHPWQTLQKVVDAHLINGENSTKGVVHAGDTIYLMNGNEGDVTLTSYNGQFNNTAYITIKAYPGAHPVLNQLTVSNCSNWAFEGLTISDPPAIRQWYTLASFSGDNDIIFSGNTLYSQANVSSWSPQEWMNSAAWKAICFSGTNSTIANNVVSNVRCGISISGNNILLSGNKIDDFADDAIDFTSSNTLIECNTITNHYGKLSDGNHNDGIQGWEIDGAANANIGIYGNIIIASNGKDSNVSVIPTGVGEDFLQGISIYAGAWNNVWVTDNVVAAAAYNGIALLGLSNSLVANNTVVSDIADPHISSWICVGTSQTGTPASHVIVRDNIAMNFQLAKIGVTDDHNISFTKYNLWSKSTGEVVVTNPAKVFVGYNPQKGLFNLALAVGSPAIAAGTSTGAATLDVTGRVRNPLKENDGAYA